MSLLLGIDTGGTYTDAALFDDKQGVLASAKALTTKHDLTIGIREALETVLPAERPDIRLVSLSTTLATNAVVEGRRSPICLLLVGYHLDALKRAGLGKALASDPVIFIDGGHDGQGEERMPLDIEAARQAIISYAPRISAFAVSSYFSVRNPAHELTLRALIHELTDLPVTCGHELTSNLDAPRRALTVALNARLIPLLQHLILAVQKMLTEQSIAAPLMVVKGDGSLIKAEIALERPVETVLSGPAASVVGARRLAGEDDVFVVDMGGTTTDIALLRNGRPVLDSAGATIGGWRTMVEAIAIHTVGLGGDSEVRWDEKEGLVVGPQRTVPLGLLSHQYPATLEILRKQVQEQMVDRFAGRFVLRHQYLEPNRDRLSATQREVWDQLAEGPVPLVDLVDDHLLKRATERLLKSGLAIMCSMTPSDAAHILGFQTVWSEEAARFGAELWLRYLQQTIDTSLQTVQDFCQQVMQQVVVQSGRVLVAASLAETEGVVLDEYVPLRRLLVDRAMQEPTENDLVRVSLNLRRPLVAIGAPVRTYYPAVAERLHTRLVIPPYAEIANAVGAVAGGVMHAVEASIIPLDEVLYRVHLPSGIKDFRDLEEAAQYAIEEATRLATAQARRAGAVAVQLETQREDQIAPLSSGEELHLATMIRVTAIGRPHLTER